MKKGDKIWILAPLSMTTGTGRLRLDERPDWDYYDVEVDVFNGNVISGRTWQTIPKDNCYDSLQKLKDAYLLLKILSD